MSIVDHAKLGEGDARCACGGVGSQLITGGDHRMVMGQNTGEYQFDPRRNARTYKNRPAAYEEKVYAKAVENLQGQAREFNRKKRASDDDWKIECIAPAPLVDSINDREGDKNKVLMDPKPFMKQCGLWLGED